MKKMLYLSLLAGFTQMSKAQSNSFPTTGNVGIGTLNPLTRLEVYDGYLLVKNLDNATDSSAIMIGHAIKDAGYKFGTSIRSITQNPGANMYGMQFFTQENYITNQTEKMRINGNGNIGMGTTNPADKLHIDPKGPGGITIGNILDGGYTSLKMSISTAQNGYALLESIKSAGSEYGVLALNPSAGNVGIGTTNPSEKLTVKGTVLAEKVKVQLSGSWPDYVFASNYKKMPLPELEKFIAENKHLPEIPSAQQVAKDGIELGTNQAALLKKIEELTLYIIDQNKELKKQNDKISYLEEKLMIIEKTQQADAAK